MTPRCPLSLSFASSALRRSRSSFPSLSVSPSAFPRIVRSSLAALVRIGAASVSHWLARLDVSDQSHNTLPELFPVTPVDGGWRKPPLPHIPSRRREFFRRAFRWGLGALRNSFASVLERSLNDPRSGRVGRVSSVVS